MHDPPPEWKKGGRNKGRKEGRKEQRKEKRKEGRNEERKEGLHRVVRHHSCGVFRQYTGDATKEGKKKSGMP